MAAANRHYSVSDGDCLRCGGPRPPAPRTHCDPCRNALCLVNRPLAHYFLARHLRRSPRLAALLRGGDGGPAAELGLLLACGRWDPARGALGTIARFTIQRALQEEAARGGGLAPVRPPFEAVRYEARPCAGRARVACRPALSLDRAVAPSADCAHPDTYGSVLPARPEPARPEPDEPTLAEMLSGLPPREAEALRLRHGEGLTLGEIGRRMGGISKERVRQLCKLGVERLRKGVAG